MHNAVESKSEISFRQIQKPTGRRVNYQKTVSGVGVVENADIVKGYEVDKDQYVLLEPEEIDAIKLESKRTIDFASTNWTRVSSGKMSAAVDDTRIDVFQERKAKSRALIVICSTNAAISRWVDREVLTFKLMGLAACRRGGAAEPAGAQMP